MMSAALIAASVLVAIAGLHFYWALGGEAGKAGAIPSRNGEPVIRPGAMSAVAFIAARDTACYSPLCLVLGILFTLSMWR